MKDVTKILDSIKEIGKTIFRRHTSIGSLLILGMLSFAVFTISQYLAFPVDEEYRSEQQAQKTKTSFDQQTIEKIERLQERQQSQRPTLPPGRINPFN